MSELICPKCGGVMRTYERSNVTVDQCAECRGLFLDRGELERLIDAEAAWSRAPQTPVPAPQSHGPPQYSHKKRRRSFFEELFD